MARPDPRSLLRLAQALLGAGALTLFFSEYAFFNEGPAFAVISGPEPGMQILSLLGFYIGFVAVLSATLSVLEVRRWESVVLAGAIFGWAVEGMVIPAVYEAVPVSFLWTAVGWHMTIDVWIGLFGLCWLMRQSWVKVLAGSVGLGILWGVWTTWIWIDMQAPTPEQFVDFSLITGVLLVIGAALLAPVFPALWTMPRPLARSVGVLAVSLFVLTGVPYPGSMLFLSLIIGATLVALVLLKSHVPAKELTPLPARSTKALGLVVTPVVASVTYASLWEADFGMISEDTILLLLVLGTGLYLVALLRAFTTA